MRLSWSISLSLIDAHCRKLPCDSHECCSDCRGPPATVVKSSNRERHAARHSARGIGFETGPFRLTNPVDSRRIQVLWLCPERPEVGEALTEMNPQSLVGLVRKIVLT